jgi:hypothetical protein
MDSIHLDIMSFMNKWHNDNIILWQIDTKWEILKYLMINFWDVYQVWSLW